MNVLLLAWVSLLLMCKSVQSGIAIKGDKLSQIAREVIDQIPDDDDIKVRNHLDKEAVILNKSSHDSTHPTETTKKDKTVKHNQQNKVKIDANDDQTPGKQFKLLLMGNPFERSGDDKLNDEKMMKEIMAQVRKGNEVIKITPQKRGKDSSNTPYTSNKNVPVKENRMDPDTEHAAIIKPNIIDLIKSKDSDEINKSIRKIVPMSADKPHKKVEQLAESVSKSQEHKNISDGEITSDSEEDEEELNEFLHELKSVPVPHGYGVGAASNLQYRGRSGDPHDQSNEESESSNTTKASDTPLESDADEKISVHQQPKLKMKTDDSDDDKKHKDKKINEYQHGFNSIAPSNIISTLPNRKCLKHTNVFERHTGSHYIAPTINLNDAILLYHNNITLLGQNGTNPKKILQDLNSIRYANNIYWHQQQVGVGTNVPSNYHYQNYSPLKNIPNQYYNNFDAFKNYPEQTYQNYNYDRPKQTYQGPEQTYQNYYYDRPKNYKSQYAQNYNAFRNYPYQYHQNVYAVENNPQASQQDYSALRNGWTYQWVV